MPENENVEIMDNVEVQDVTNGGGSNILYLGLGAVLYAVGSYAVKRGIAAWKEHKAKKQGTAKADDSNANGSVEAEYVKVETVK